jgi:hypothetical protein
MHKLALTLAGMAFAVAGCGPKALELPTDTVERAATCGVVAAAEARVGQAPTEIAKPLPLAAQSRILHYALLAGAAEKPFSQERVGAVVNRMPEIGDKVTKGKWQALVPACAEAYPQTVQTKPVALPANGLDGQLSCYTLAAFLDKALSAQGDAYIADLAKYGALRRKLDDRIGTKLVAAGKSSAETQADDRAGRLGAAAELGPPVAVMDACIAKYG